MANNQLGIRLFGKRSSVLFCGSFMLLGCVADQGPGEGYWAQLG